MRTTAMAALLGDASDRVALQVDTHACRGALNRRPFHPVVDDTSGLL